MGLKKLIENQIIIIDDHKRGAGEVKNFDNLKDDVHIDKITNYKIDGKRQRVKIRVPINSENPLKVESKSKKIIIPSNLKKEIQQAFENKLVREAFINDIVEILANYDSILTSEEKTTKVLERLSKHFDLKWGNETIKKYLDDVLQTYTQFFVDNKDRKYFIKLDKQKITIAANNGYAKQYKKFNP